MILDWPVWAQGILGYVIVQRLAELPYARRNTKRLLARGGVEYGAGHYPLFFLLHGSWLLAIAVFCRPMPMPPILLLIAYGFTQVLRFWTLASIGTWWTTRIISAPHFPRVKKGPYRFLKHPNYTVVALEIAILPLLLGAWQIAVIFTLLNAALLYVRIGVENSILQQRSGPGA